MKNEREKIEARKENAISDCLEKNGVFFAFSKSQLNERKIEGVKYTDLSGGTFCPTDRVKAFEKELLAVITNYLAEMIKELGQDEIILSELQNHEAFYTWDIESTIEALLDYGFSRASIETVFNRNCQKEEFQA